MITIRLKPTGTKSRKQWRIVVSDSRVSRNGRLMEEIGTYNPLVDPPEVRIQKERYEEWIQKGAKPSGTVKALIQKETKRARAN